MSSGIYYNQSVTTDILNGIAKDLGNTSFNGFTTNKFGADELNKITKSLVTSGVLLSDNACEPKAVGNSVVIQTGTIVFENGAKIQITEAKTFDKTASKVIYALNNVSEGVASIVMSDDYPESGTDFVKLASIDASGTLNDERKLSSAKVQFSSGQSNVYTKRTVNTPAGEEQLVDSITLTHAVAYVIVKGEDWSSCREFSNDYTSVSWRLSDYSLPKILTIERAGMTVNFYVGGTRGESSVDVVFV